jgi:predicted ABC-type transport system involved in lysophospholipase L1 biosynthesis ATPase subunit
MVGLRLESLRVAEVCSELTLDVPVGVVRAAIVRDQAAVHALANAVVGLDRTRCAGRVLVGGMDVRQQHHDHRRRRRHRTHRHCLIRLVPASGGLVPEITVAENMWRLRCPTARVSKALGTVMTQEAAARLGMADLLDRRPEHLTAGERRLAGLALALCWEPIAVVLEDAPDLPTWHAVLEERHRRRDRLASVGLAPPAAHAAFARVAVLVITTDAARVWQLDHDPVWLEPNQVTVGSMRPATAPSASVGDDA